MGAVGATGHAIYPVFGARAADTNKVFYGIVHSLVAVVLVKVGGYAWFERIMGVCIGLMFVVVVVTAVALQPPAMPFLMGLIQPGIPPGGVAWTVALMGGVGGTLTVLCYGYWIREEGRQGSGQLRTCRIDLATGYILTAVFGLAMMVIGSSLGPMQGGGATLIVDVATQLNETLGPFAKWMFLIGAWGAVFSSLLGVWQSVPYLFADFWQLFRRDRQETYLRAVSTKSIAYRVYLYGIAVIPMLGLVAVPFKTMQKTYAVVGALFIPLLAIVLLLLNGRSTWVGSRHKNSLATNLLLLVTLLFFLWAGWLQIRSKFGG
jgi:Mn2+/Fe2+ NRAMP family transporter